MMRLPSDKTRRTLILIIGLSLIVIAAYILVTIFQGVAAGDEAMVNLIALVFLIPLIGWRLLRMLRFISRTERGARRSRLSGYHRDTWKDD